MKKHRVEELLDFFDEELEVAKNHKNSKGGQQVPYHGTFAGTSMSTLINLERWSRDFREAFKKDIEEKSK